VKPFGYASPASLQEVFPLLASSRPLAGGTDLLPLMKAGIAAPEALVDLKRLGELSSAIDASDGVTLGALTRLSDIETHPAIVQRYTALAQAAAAAATPQLRNMATIGGNLLQRPRCWYFRNAQVPCWLKGGTECPAREGENRLHAVLGEAPCVAVHPSDLAPALLALDAEVQLHGAHGERVVPLARLFAPPTSERRAETTLAPDELIAAVRLPRAVPGEASVYLKAMDRRAWAFALAGVALRARLERGRIADIRVVLGGVATVPWRAEAAERLLQGAVASKRLIEEAAQAALHGAVPLRHNGYKLPLARALVRRALDKLIN
jgi:xanthine dehydrogenase YagS FAD-binding subunit